MQQGPDAPGRSQEARRWGVAGLCLLGALLSGLLAGRLSWELQLFLSLGLLALGVGLGMAAPRPGRAQGLWRRVLRRLWGWGGLCWLAGLALSWGGCLPVLGGLALLVGLVFSLHALMELPAALPDRPFLVQALEPLGIGLSVCARQPHWLALEGALRGHPLRVELCNDPGPGWTRIAVSVAALARGRATGLYVTASGPDGRGIRVTSGDPVLDHALAVWCEEPAWAAERLRGRAALLLAVLHHEGARIEGDEIVLVLPGLAPSAGSRWSTEPDPRGFQAERDLEGLLRQLGELADALGAPPEGRAG